MLPFWFILMFSMYLSPINPIIPVQGATTADWNHDTYWYHPWGSTGVHRGIDIFAEQGPPVIAAMPGYVAFTGQMPKGGNTVLVLTTKMRFHVYAHLEEITAESGKWVEQGEQVGTVGQSGNAEDAPPHVHYAVITMFPYVWLIDPDAPQGWVKMYFLNTHEMLMSDQWPWPASDE